MTKIILCILSFVLGSMVFGIWAVGSHGHMRFRPHMNEDWFFAVLLILFWGTSLYIIFSTLFKIISKPAKPPKKKKDKKQSKR
jgi:hypothetical protein